MTTGEKIMLHLIEYPKDKLITTYSPEVRDLKEILPVAISQNGIAESLEMEWNHIPRNIRKLIDRGFLEEYTAHVEGMGRRRKVYFLTEKGILFALELRETIKNKTIMLIDEKGMSKEEKISNVNLYLKSKARLIDIVTQVSPDGILRLKELERRVEGSRLKAKPKKWIEFIETCPVPKRFYGRERELGRLRAFSNSKEEKVMVIKGMAGIGKTLLTAKFIQEVKGRENLYWYQFHQWDSLRKVLSPLSEFLYMLGRERLRSYLASITNVQLRELYDVLESDLNGLRAILVFDDVHKVERDVKDLFTLIVGIVRVIENLKLIFTTRYAVPFYSRVDVNIKKVVREMEIEGLDKKSAVSLLTARRIPIRDAEQIYKQTKGHPLALELITSKDDFGRPSDINKFIQEEIFSRLTEREKRLLMFASVYRYPVLSNAFHIDEDFDHDILDRLVEKSLIREIPFEGYDVHDIIREFVQARLMPQQRKLYHREAADYYKDSAIPNLIERMYHLIKAEEYGTVVELAVESAQELITSGYADELKQRLEEITQDVIPLEDWIKVLVMKGDVSYALGEQRDAIIYYQDSINLNAKDDYFKAHAFKNIGYIKSHEGNWNVALENFNESLRILKRLKEREGMADVYRGIGKIHWGRHELDKAEECYRKSERYAKATKNDLDLARAYIEFGNLYRSKGEHDNSLKYYNKGLEIFEKIGDLYGIAAALNNLGGIYYLKENWDRAIECFEGCIRSAVKSGNIRLRAMGLLNLGGVLTKVGDYDKAIECYENALSIFSRLEEKPRIAAVHIDYGTLLAKRKEWKKAKEHFETSIKILKELSIPEYMARAFYHYGMMLKDKGESKDAKRLFKRVLEIQREREAMFLEDRVRAALKELSSAR